MSIQDKLRIYLITTKRINDNNGFTLIELLVVVVIVGLLSAIALPNLLKQVGKARETEAKQDLSSLIHAQQAYHYETSTFADSMNKLEAFITLDSKYYTFPDPTPVNRNIVKHKAIPTNPVNNETKTYSIGTYYEAGFFNIVLCQAQGINNDVDAPNTSSGNCTNNGIKLK